MNLDGVDAGCLGAAALALEIIFECWVVRVVAGRREAIAEVAGRPVPDAVLDIHVLQELDGLRTPQVALFGGGECKLVGREAGHGSLLGEVGRSMPVFLGWRKRRGPA